MKISEMTSEEQNIMATLSNRLHNDQRYEMLALTTDICDMIAKEAIAVIRIFDYEVKKKGKYQNSAWYNYRA